MSNYIFGQGTPWTYDQLQQKRQIAQQLMTNMGTPKNVGEGLNAIGDALLARGIEKRAAKEEERMRGEAQGMISGIMGGSADLNALMAAAGNPMIMDNPGYATVVNSLIGNALKQPEPVDPLDQRRKELELAQLEQEISAFGQPEYAILSDAEEAELGLDTSGTYQRARDGKVSPIGTPSTNISVDTGSKAEFWDTLNNDDAKRVGAILDEGAAAANQMASLDAAEQLALDPNIYTGAGAEAVLALKKLGRSLGLDVEGIESAEGFQAVARKSALDAMGGSLGAGFSDADRSFVTGQVAGLENTPEGNFIIIDVQRRIAQRKLEAEQIAMDWRYGNTPEDQRNYGELVRRLREHAAANPLFPPGYAEDVKARAAAATSGIATTGGQQGGEVDYSTMPAPEGIDPQDWEFLTPEERRLWAN